jgi:signal transduction histidine kinase
MAFRGLPEAVARLEHREALGGLTPDQVADHTPAPVQVRGRDELAEVGKAFNAVHREAIRTAAEQAQLRMSIAAIMLNLARRGQKLTGRLTAVLDDVERDELDPNRLAQLYQLDLMATLLGGTNESLLVLGGAGSAQVRTVDEPLSDVLHGAVGQVEQYPRIEPGVVDEGVAIRASVVDEVVKLLAELLDNACRYSPPQTPVRVDARWLADRVIIQIADEGIGIEPARRAELNHRLATRPPLDLAAVEAMGLTVVAYLAARHQIRVELRDGHRRGTIAEVTLPPELVKIGADRRYLAPPRPRITALSTAPAAPLFRRAEQPDLPWPPPAAPAQVAPAPAAPAQVGPAQVGPPAGPPQPAGQPVGQYATAGQPAAGRYATAGQQPPVDQHALAGGPPGRSGAPAPTGPPSRTDPPIPRQRSIAYRGGVPVPGRTAARGGRDQDRTAELRLPIFEQVRRSQWFTSASELTPPVTGTGNGPAAAEPGAGTPPEPTPVRDGAPTSWQTVADQGWQAAARAADPRPAGTTHSGLPVRRPGAQLVPGGVDDPTGAAGSGPATDWRDPVQVSAVAAAYSRGLSTGRAQYSTEPTATHGNGAPVS